MSSLTVCANCSNHEFISMEDTIGTDDIQYELCQRCLAPSRDIKSYPTAIRKVILESISALRAPPRLIRQNGWRHK